MIRYLHATVLRKVDLLSLCLNYVRQVGKSLDLYDTLIDGRLKRVGDCVGDKHGDLETRQGKETYN